MLFSLTTFLSHWINVKSKKRQLKAAGTPGPCKDMMMIKKTYISVLLIVLTITSSQAAAGTAYRGIPQTVAHEFINIEKDSGATSGDCSVLDDLIGKALSVVTYSTNSTTEDALRTLLQIDLLLKQEGFVFGQNYLLSTGLKNKTIDCDNYCALYIAIAEVMKIPVVPVYAPNHSFLRFYFDDGSYINWEPTQARPQQDSYYIKELGISGDSVSKGVYMKTLTRQEFIAVEYNNIGSHFMLKKNYSEAVMYFTAAARFYPAFSSAWHNRGSSYYAMGRSEEALSDLQRANELDPVRASTHNTMGDIYLDKKEYARAAEEFKTSIKINPSDYVPYNNMAYIMKMLGKEKESQSWYKKSQEIKAVSGKTRHQGRSE